MSDPTTDTTRLERNEHVEHERMERVAKPRDLTTRRTRRWKRGLLVAAALGLAVVVSRWRGRDREGATTDAASVTGRGPDDDGPGIARRLVVAAVTAAVAAAVEQRRGEPATGKR